MTERLYYHDSFLKTFKAQVRDVRLHSQTAAQSVWQIALDRSAFYPTSGGQPYDTGMLTAASRSGTLLEVGVDAVEEDEQGEVWHTTLKPLLAGTEITGTIDWPRRLDHMQQHSGQHLLSAVFAHELRAMTVSFHLGEEVSTIDLATETLAHHSLERVERIANELIAEDRSVTVTQVSRADAEAKLAAGILRKLPPIEGTIRLIEIADYDLNACGGTHVHATGQIGGLHLRSVERVRQGLRVEFVCGLRAVTSARQDYGALSRTASALSVSRNQVPEAAERVLSEVKAAQKRSEKILEELAGYQAARLAVEEQIHRGIREVRRTFPDREAAYVKLLASRLAASVPQTVALFAATQQEPAVIVLSRSSGMEFHCGDVLKAALAESGLRGGGSADLAQGQAPRSQADEILQRISTAIRGARLADSEESFPNRGSAAKL